MLLFCTAHINNAVYPLIRNFSGHLAETLATLVAGQTEEALRMAEEDFAFLVITATDYPEAVELLGCNGLRIVPSAVHVRSLVLDAPDFVIASLSYSFKLKISNDFATIEEAHTWLRAHEGFADCMSATMTTAGETGFGFHMAASSRESVTVSFSPIED